MPPKKPTKVDANEFDDFINKEEAEINSELFKNNLDFQELVKC